MAFKKRDVLIINDTPCEIALDVEAESYGNLTRVVYAAGSSGNISRMDSPIKTIRITRVGRVRWIKRPWWMRKKSK